MEKTFVLTNIPTPYRNHFFNCIFEQRIKYNIDVKVYFMSSTEKGRFWNYKDWKTNFNYEFLKNFGFYFKNIYFHFNPSIFSKLKKDKPDYLIVAGAWNLPTVMYLMLFKFLVKDIKMGFWNEGNFKDEIYSKKYIIKKLKKYVFNKFDFLISSGVKSNELIKFYVKNPKIVKLPNVIDERLFKPKTYNPGRMIFSNPRKIFIAASLDERKNVFFFLKSINLILTNKQVSIKIAGEGENKKIIQEYINNQNLNDSVKLLGQISESQVIKELDGCDIYVLASRREPFSLSLVEASFMGKPLLISNTIGSVSEIINNNGLTFDPYSSKDIYEKTLQMISLKNEELSKMSLNSLENAAENFSSYKVTTTFLEDILRV